MRKPKFLLPLALALLLSACGAGSPSAGSGGGSAAAPDEETGITFQETLPDEPYEAVESKLYPQPEGGYVGDVMPFVTKDGTLELYYLFDSSHNGQGYHPIYKYSTKDLRGFEDHGMMLNYGQGSDPDITAPKPLQ